MDWLKGMNEVIDFIESNLTEPIQYETLAKMVACSAYEFSRVFSFMTGVTISEYIRRRRLSNAVFDIQKGDAKIIDIALKYCYESPSTFTRAFKEMHGVTPLAARKSGTPLVMYPRMSFALTIMGAGELRYRIEKKDEFELMGLSQLVDVDDNRNAYEPMLYTSTKHELTLPEKISTESMNFAEQGFLGDLMLVDKEKGIYEAESGVKVQMEFRGDVNRTIALGIIDAGFKSTESYDVRLISAIDYKLQEGRVRRYLGVETNEAQINADKIMDNISKTKFQCDDEPRISRYKIPIATWAVFTVKSENDKDSMSRAYMRILTEWFPGSSYVRDESMPHLEKHVISNAKQNEWEIWIPVTRKEGVS